MSVMMIVMIATCEADRLIFSDDFNQFNFSVWQHEITLGGGGNWEFQWYTNNRSNSNVINGTLILTPTLTADNLGESTVESGDLNIWGDAPADLCTGNAFYGCDRQGGGGNIINPIQSSAVRTVNSFSLTYGKVTVRAKLPCGDWIWPAIWLLPKYNAYGEWPASGEIDIVESRGNKNYPNGANWIGSTLHFGPSWMTDAWQIFHGEYTLNSGNFCDDFHVFGMVWNENGIYTYLDNEKQIILNATFDEPLFQKGGWDKTSYANPWIGRPFAAPFDQDFYLIFNVAVGGINFFPDGVGGKPWNNDDPHASTTFWNAKSQWYPTWTGQQAMVLDWVRVYAFD